MGSFKFFDSSPYKPWTPRVGAKVENQKQQTPAKPLLSGPSLSWTNASTLWPWTGHGNFFPNLLIVKWGKHWNLNWGAGAPT